MSAWQTDNPHLSPSSIILSPAAGRQFTFHHYPLPATGNSLSIAIRLPPLTGNSLSVTIRLPPLTGNSLSVTMPSRHRQFTFHRHAPPAAARATAPWTVRPFPSHRPQASSAQTRQKHPVMEGVFTFVRIANQWKVLFPFVRIANNMEGVLRSYATHIKEGAFPVHQDSKS